MQPSQPIGGWGEGVHEGKNSVLFSQLHHTHTITDRTHKNYRSRLLATAKGVLGHVHVFYS